MKIGTVRPEINIAHTIGIEAEQQQERSMLVVSRGRESETPLGCLEIARCIE